MIDSNYRSLYQKWCIGPILKLPCLKNAHPHLITLFALLSGAFVLPLLLFGYRWPALLLLALSGFFDTLDGSLARVQQKTSSSGAVFDIVCDRLVEFCVILGLYSVDPVGRSLLTLLMLGSVLLCITSFLVVGIFTDNQSEKGFHYSPGIMERSEAFIFFAVMILFPELFSYLATAFTLLVALTAALRVYQFHKIRA